MGAKPPISAAGQQCLLAPQYRIYEPQPRESPLDRTRLHDLRTANVCIHAASPRKPLVRFRLCSGGRGRHRSMGPLDLLLELARVRKLDLARLSILDPREQSGGALEAALAGGYAPLSRLGDWLVMAAHLALLRSRLLLPEDSRERTGRPSARRRAADHRPPTL